MTQRLMREFPDLAPPVVQAAIDSAQRSLGRADDVAASDAVEILARWILGSAPALVAA